MCFINFAFAVLFAHQLHTVVLLYSPMLLQVSLTNQKLSDITAAVMAVLQASCGECVSEMVIDNQFFVCYPQSPSHVTFQGRLEGTSERESGSFISLIEEWVRGGKASVIVTGVLMTVDPHCSVVISSLSEGECSPTTDTTTTDRPSVATSPAPPTVAEGLGDKNSNDGGTTTAIIAGAVVAVIVTVLIISITVAIVAIVFLVLKNRRGELSLRNSNERFAFSFL